MNWQRQMDEVFAMTDYERLHPEAYQRKLDCIQIYLDRQRRVTAGKFAVARCAARTRVSTRFRLLILLVCVFVLVAAVSSRARTITSFQADGDCFDLATRYLKERGVAYIVSDDLRGMQCHWNFSGNTQADFDAWCRRKALSCGGNPYYVGFDSTWYAGERMPSQKAKQSPSA